MTEREKVGRILRDDTEHNGVEYVRATDYDALLAEVEALRANLARVTGPREPPHCPSCDCLSRGVRG